MDAPTTENRRKTLLSDGTKAFWAFVNRQHALREAERLARIKKGFPVQLLQAVRLTFNLQQEVAADLLGGSASTFEFRIHEGQTLGVIASECLDRIAFVSNLAREVFEDQDTAAQWLSVPNKALGNAVPVLLCETEMGAKRVGRMLHALEWGGAA